MAKLRPAPKSLKAPEPKKPDYARDAKGAIPCLLLVIGAILAVGWIFSAMLKSAK